VGDGDVVAMLMHNCPEAMELMVATRHLGAQWCPVNWHFKTDEVGFILADSRAKVFIAEATLLAALPGLVAGTAAVWTTGGELPGMAAWEPLRDASPSIDTPPAAPRGAMFYTSGTTGRPKDIVRQPMSPAQAQAAAAMRHMAYGVAPDMRALLNAPWYHSAPNGYALGIAQENGWLHIEERFDAERTLQLIHEQRRHRQGQHQPHQRVVEHAAGTVSLRVGCAGSRHGVLGDLANGIPRRCCGRRWVPSMR
jgi:long-chain acyl-CoA synthetase